MIETDKEKNEAKYLHAVSVRNVGRNWVVNWPGYEDLRRGAAKVTPNFCINERRRRRSIEGKAPV